MNDCSFIRLNNVSKFEEWYHRFKKKNPYCFAGQRKPPSDLGDGIDGPYPAD